MATKGKKVVVEAGPSDGAHGSGKLLRRQPTTSVVFPRRVVGASDSRTAKKWESIRSFFYTVSFAIILFRA
jgi:hypothetical protein